MLLLALTNEVEYARAFANRVIELENQFRHVAQSEAGGKLVTQEAGSVFQRPDGILLLTLVAQHAHKHLSVAQITTDLNTRYTRETNARIFHPSTQQIAQLYGDEFTKFFLSMWIWHTSISLAAYSNLVLPDIRRCARQDQI